MRKILHGIRQFQRTIFPRRQRHFEELVSGQEPSTLFITCSDSRIVPEMLTQTEPGELFVLRNAGNLVPPYTSTPSGEAATIEYAVKVLKVKDIVVCGHSHCGAIMGLMRPETLKDLPAVEQWLAHAEKCQREIIEHGSVTDPDDDMLTSAVKSNVLVQLDHLRTFPAVSQGESAGELTLHSWFYRFETGEVLAFEDAAGKFVSVHSGLNNEASVA